MLTRYCNHRLQPIASAIIKRNQRALKQTNASIQIIVNNKYISTSTRDKFFSTEAVSIPVKDQIKDTHSKSDSVHNNATEFKPTEARKYQFFTNVIVNDDGVAIIEFDNPSKSVNTISFSLKDEAKILWKNEIESNPSVRAVVFTSAKESGFIAGADINDIRDVEDKNQLRDMIKDGMDFFQHMKRKKIPLICAINGPALGTSLIIFRIFIQ